MNLFKEGCSAFAWDTLDGKHLFARNFDFNRLAAMTKIIFVPRSLEYYTLGSLYDNNLEDSNKRKANYCVLGIGTLALKSTPAIYDGMNEKGLMGAQLYYRNNAKFFTEIKENTYPVAPPFLVYHLLASCKSLIEVKEELAKITLVHRAVLGTVAPLHFIFTDKTSKSLVIEVNEKGLNIYEDAIGILTNSPSYDYHLKNLLNYANLRVKDYDTIKFNNTYLKQEYSGNGLRGLPGDFSSPSRFVRLAFFKEYAQKGKNEEQGVMYLARLMHNVSFPLGLVEVTDNENITEVDENIMPYDYTIYTDIMCAESKRFYYFTYQNLEIKYIDMNDYLDSKELITFEIADEIKIRKVNQDEN